MEPAEETKVFLGIGQYHATTRPTRVVTVLGSCISVTMHHPATAFAAICHASLPSAPPGLGRDYRYVDLVIPAMLSWFKRHRIPARDLVVKLFGGADMYASPHRPLAQATVGRQNSDMALKVLALQGLEPSAGDVGGRHGRSLVFHTTSGEVLIRKTVRSLAQARQRSV